jgi:hypothetical protein
MSSFSEKSDEKHVHISVDSQQVDTGAQLVAGFHSPLDPDESLRIRYARIYRAFLLLTILNKAENRLASPAPHVQYVSEPTLAF